MSIPILCIAHLEVTRNTSQRVMFFPPQNGPHCISGTSKSTRTFGKKLLHPDLRGSFASSFFGQVVPATRSRASEYGLVTLARDRALRLVRFSKLWLLFGHVLVPKKQKPHFEYPKKGPNVNASPRRFPNKTKSRTWISLLVEAGPLRSSVRLCTSSAAPWETVCQPTMFCRHARLDRC